MAICLGRVLDSNLGRGYNILLNESGGKRMSTDIYLIRHGESKGNLEKRFLGHTNWDLTERGYEQARCAAAFFKDIKVDAVYSSDLLRAFNTAKAVADLKGLKVIGNKNLREIFAGDWEGLKFDEIVKIYGDSLWKNWVDAEIADIITPNGENITQLLERVYAAIEQIAKAHDGQTVVIALHATPIRVMMKWLQSRTLERLCDTPWVANASVTKLVYENGSFSVAFADECSHLGELKTVLPKGV